MRILIYGINYSPELTGIGKYTGEMAEWLAMKGHEVRVVTAPPYYPEWQIGKGYSPFTYRHEDMEGVRVRRCPLYVPKRPTGKKRIAHLLTFAFSSFPVALKECLFWKPEVVFAVEPPFLCAPGAVAIARLLGIKSWLHVQDLELDAAAKLGMVRSGGLMDKALRFESVVMRSFTVVSTISPRMRERIIDKGVDENRTRLFPNWVDTGQIFPLRDSPFRGELGIGEEKTVLLYSGNMGEKQGLGILVDAAKKLHGFQDLIFVLCGDGAVKERLKKSAEGLTNVKFLPLQPLERLNELLNAADIHLLPQREDAADLVMPSKLPGIFASGRPVIATAKKGTQVAEAVKGRGIAVDPGDLNSLTEAILRLANDPEERRRMGDEARAEALRSWGRDEILSRFENELKNIVAIPVPSLGI